MAKAPYVHVPKDPKVKRPAPATTSRKRVKRPSSLKGVSGTASAGVGVKAETNVAHKGPSKRWQPTARQEAEINRRARLRRGSASRAVSQFLRTGQRVTSGKGTTKSGTHIATVLANTGTFQLGKSKIVRNAMRDTIDLPANTVTSIYGVTKAGITGHPKDAAKMLIDPVIETVKHPVKSFTEHPLNTVLIARGGEGAVGHTAGKVLRTVPSKTTRKLASTERAPKVVPGTRKVVRRQYSKDVIVKAGQVTAERARRKARVKKGGPVEEHATKREIHRAVDEDVQAAKIVTQHNQGVTAKRALDAIAPRKGKARVRVRRREKPTAATSLAAQGVTTTSKADLKAYLSEIEKAKPTRENQATRNLVTEALKDFDPVKVEKASRAYQKLATELETQVVDRGLVTPRKAEQTRLESVRVRRVKQSSSPVTAKVKKQAAGVQRKAKQEANHADAEYKTALANAQAARTQRGIPPREHDALLRAIDRRDKTHVALETAKAEAHTAKAAHIRTRLAPGEEPAYVSHQPIDPRAAALPVNTVKVPVKISRKGTAVKEGTLDAHPAKLVEQAVGTQRLIDAADARKRFIDEWGHRNEKGVMPFRDRPTAEGYARKQGIGEDWRAMERDDGQFALVPKRALDRLEQHNTRVDAQHPLLRSTGGQWRRNVLAFSPRWLTGNTVEAALRSVVAGAGPLSYRTASKTLAELERVDPVAAQSLRARSTGGGNYESAANVAGKSLIRRDPAAEDLGRFSTALLKLRETPGPKQLADAYGTYTDLVFRALNGRVETQFQTLMLGKALRDHPLMSDRLRKASREAVQEAAQGLRDTAVQAELGRLVDDMYGQYGKFSPKLQAGIANYTPFFAWTRNATIFLGKVLPRDHPVLSGLLASANEATEEWRKSIGSYYDPEAPKDSGQLAPYLQGSILGDAGSHLRVARYTPFGLFNSGIEAGTPLEGLAGLLLPNVTEIMDNVLKGKDWKDKSLQENPSLTRDLIAGAASFIEGQVPLASQAADVTGVKLPNEADVANRKVPPMKVRLRKTFDPFMYTPASSYNSSKRKSSTSSSSSSGGGSWGASTYKGSGSSGGGWGSSSSGSSSSSGGGW